MRQARELRRLVTAIERETGLCVPMVAEQLAAAFQLRLLPRAGQRFELREGSIAYDLDVPPAEANMLISRACAAYFLRQAGLIKTSAITIGELAEALCGTGAPCEEEEAAPAYSILAGTCSTRRALR